eukprot:COSAG06_NODE_3453_length_5320_cov_49.582839_4_plen_87_part_00
MPSVFLFLDSGAWLGKRFADLLKDPDQNTVAKVARSSVLYPLFLWVYNGLKIYLEDYWDCMELFLYSFFLVAFYCKANMLVSADTF